MKETLRFLGLTTVVCAPLLLNPHGAYAQAAVSQPVPIQISPAAGGRSVIVGQPPTPTPAQPTQPGQPAQPGKPAAKEQTAEDLIVAQFPKLTFDRRQSIILKTWASPWPIPIPEPDPEIYRALVSLLERGAIST